MNDCQHISFIFSFSRQRWGPMIIWPHLHEPKVGPWPRCPPPPCGRQWAVCDIPFGCRPAHSAACRVPATAITSQTARRHSDLWEANYRYLVHPAGGPRRGENKPNLAPTLVPIVVQIVILRSLWSFSDMSSCRVFTQLIPSRQYLSLKGHGRLVSSVK